MALDIVKFKEDKEFIQLSKDFKRLYPELCNVVSRLFKVIQENPNGRFDGEILTKLMPEASSVSSLVKTDAEIEEIKNRLNY